MAYEDRNQPQKQFRARNGNSAMQEKMERIRPNIHTRHNFSDPYRNVSSWKEDGVDHINIFAFGKTGLGQALSHASPIRLKHSVFGNFNSMECFWHYIQSEEQDDRIRTMAGKNLQTFGRKLTRRMVTNFRAIIMDSNYQRIMQNPKVMEEVKASTLPFDCYYIDRESGMRKRQSYFYWMLQGFEEIRNAIKEGREPNFDSLKDDRNSEIYQFVRPQVSTVVNTDGTEEKAKPYSLMKDFLKKPQQNIQNPPGTGKKKKKKNRPVDGSAPQTSESESGSPSETPGGGSEVGAEVTSAVGGSATLDSVRVTTVTPSVEESTAEATAETQEQAQTSTPQAETPMEPEAAAVGSEPEVTI